MAIEIRKPLVDSVILELHEIFKDYRLTVGEVLTICTFFISVILEEYPDEEREQILEHIIWTIRNYLGASG